MQQTQITLCGVQMPLYALDTLVVGSGCAGLNAADTLVDLGRDDLAVLTEGMNMGTSRNTGSDKQTYYKLSLAADEADSVGALAQTLVAGGSVHSDTALIEAACSVRCFMKLVNLGVPFPTNAYGEYVGYKTDHDPRQRATSAGPLTSKLMTQALERSVRGKGVRVFDRMLAIQLIMAEGTVRGVLAIDLDRKSEAGHGLTLFSAAQVILATGGPAGVYADSVYPCGHTGMTGMAIEAGAHAVNLQEWQYGLASADFRWNVSGTYQQVLPRYISVDAQGVEREFLPAYFDTAPAALDAVFLKGYQWPFDSRKVGGSSLIDLLVHREAAQLGRKVYLDFTRDPSGLDEDFAGIGDEARDYLRKSDALVPTPIARLARMNPDAIALYLAHGIDLAKTPLRVAVCAQHCNGGLAVDGDWQTSLAGLYAVGELAGTFGVYRPGGAALNSAQVGAMRAAQHIACTCERKEFDKSAFESVAAFALSPYIEGLFSALSRAHLASGAYKNRVAAQRSMSEHAALLRSPDALDTLYAQFSDDLRGFWEQFTPKHENGLVQMLKTRDALITQTAMLGAMRLSAQVYGSRGAALVLADDGVAVSPALPEYRIRAEKAGENQVLQTVYDDGGMVSLFAPVREVTLKQDWFENVWREYRAREQRRSYDRRSGEAEKRRSGEAELRQK